MQVELCRHIRPNGLQCQAIALKRGPFCYFHRRLHDTHRVYRNTIVARPDLERRGAIFDLGPLEDSLAIQIAISKTVNAIATNMIDLKHGRAILYGLHLAATNARRLNPTPEPTHVIRETQPDPTALLEETATLIAPEGATVEVPTTNLPHEQIPVTGVISTEGGDSRRSGETPAFVPESPNHHQPLTLCAAEDSGRLRRLREGPLQCRTVLLKGTASKPVLIEVEGCRKSPGQNGASAPEVRY